MPVSPCWPGVRSRPGRRPARATTRSGWPTPGRRGRPRRRCATRPGWRGGGLHRLLRRLRPDGAGATWLRPLVAQAVAWRPLVLGALAADLGLDDRRTALALAYDEVGSIASAALKLLPLDPLTSVDWSFGAADDIAAAVEVAVGISGVEGLPALAAPQLEAWQQCHATHDRRLFHA